MAYSEAELRESLVMSRMLITFSAVWLAESVLIVLLSAGWLIW